MELERRVEQEAPAALVVPAEQLVRAGRLLQAGPVRLRRRA